MASASAAEHGAAADGAPWLQPQHPTPATIHFATGNKKKLEEVSDGHAPNGGRQDAEGCAHKGALLARAARAASATRRPHGAVRAPRDTGATLTDPALAAPQPNQGGGDPGGRPEAAVHGGLCED